ncbi:UNVERIFIED_CONTAM: hypothetical protein FKN15_010502 [Acipenser sinensis]
MTTNREIASVALTGSMEKEKWLPQYDGFNPSVGGTECVIPGSGLPAALIQRAQQYLPNGNQGYNSCRPAWLCLGGLAVPIPLSVGIPW